MNRSCSWTCSASTNESPSTRIRNVPGGFSNGTDLPRWPAALVWMWVVNSSRWIQS